MENLNYNGLQMSLLPQTENPIQHAEANVNQQAKFSEHLKKLDSAFNQIYQDIYKLGTNPSQYKEHSLPLARIKKIMKADEDVKMISAEGPCLFTRACEMFILEITHRAWFYSEENKRRTLQKSDISQAIATTDIFDFLLDVIPKDDQKALHINPNQIISPNLEMNQDSIPPQTLGFHKYS